MILFDHIPRTGGTTLRIILNKIYGQDRVFFIKSTEIGKSLKEFLNLPHDVKNQIRVLSGHGASIIQGQDHFSFILTILREPISLFVSQYNYLRVSPNSVFLEEVSRLKSLEDYMDYAILKGQDNLLTRYISGSVEWLADPDIHIPDMEKEGDILLEVAKSRLPGYDAILDLSTFDQGIYHLSQKLGWPSIPIYRRSNKSYRKAVSGTIKGEILDRLKHLLRFDIELYRHFREQAMDISTQPINKYPKYFMFRARQEMVKHIAVLIGRR